MTRKTLVSLFLLVAVLVPSALAVEPQDRGISLRDRAVLPFLALRDRYEERRYPGVALTYRYQIDDADRLRPRREWTPRYRELRRRAFALIQGRDVETSGRWSDAINTIGQMRQAQAEVRP